MIWLAWHNDNTSQRAVRCTKAEIISHFAGLTKEFPVSSAQPGWERFWRGLRGPTPLTADPVALSTPAKPRSHKWNQSFVRGEWSKFTADGLLTKSHTTVTTGLGSAAPTLGHALHSHWCRHNFCYHSAFMHLSGACLHPQRDTMVTVQAAKL